MESDTSALLAKVTARVQALEDQLALYQAVSTYGPAVDSLECDAAASLWAEGGVYDAGVAVMQGRDDIVAMLRSEVHGNYVAKGCAHSMSLPLIKIEGDRAIGLGYHRLFVRDKDGYALARLTVSRWDWVRTPQGWKAQRRIHRLLDGSEPARALLRETLHDITSDLTSQFEA